MQKSRKRADAAINREANYITFHSRLIYRRRQQREINVGILFKQINSILSLFSCQNMWKLYILILKRRIRILKMRLGVLKRQDLSKIILKVHIKSSLN